MTHYEPGDVVLVRFPFTDLSSTKNRPALVLSTPKFTMQQGDVVVLALTSRPQRHSSFRLARWRAAGLPKPTWLKPVIGTLAQSLVLRRLGKLDAADQKQVVVVLRQLIASKFFA